MVAATPGMLERDRKRSGFTVWQVAWRLGISPREYRELEAGEGWPTWETWDRMVKLLGPQTFLAETALASRLARSDTREG